MRVISGSAKGTNLKSLDGDATRPTADRVKESAFTILQFDLDGKQVLDLFSGSGQMGIEALSRGAEHAVFVDNNAECVKIIKLNLVKTHLDHAAEVQRSDAISFIKNCKKKFDIVFLDPPYRSGLLNAVFEYLPSLLIPDSLIMCECAADEHVHLPGYMILLKTYNYGKTNLLLYRVIK